MFRLSHQRQEAFLAQRAIQRAFQPHATKSIQTLSTPGVVIRDATVLVRRDLNLWAYFRDQPNERGALFCWFGVGEPGWQATIEINIPTHRTLSSYTQLVTDMDGEIYLAHKGGLGGGKFTVSPGVFSDLINGFEREKVRDGRHELEYFVLGRISEPRQLLKRIKTFVDEAKRIRVLRRNQVQFKRALESAGGTIIKGRAIGSDEYKGETVGSGSYWIRRRIKFERIHARVQRALARELRRRKFKCGDLRQKHGLGPDLYVKDSQNRMTQLFEIKVGRDSQSTFTALGQLLVYSAAENHQPLKTLVTQGLPASPQFKMAIESQKIRVLFYKINERLKVTFDRLDEFLGWLR
jgi:hypothetical protein